ncbi:hypothetical protein HCA58_14045 [Micromonospora sp. HNM0581]|uniref:hypothetical protein n=1 Tax=Micromonospora sp. HNM0581 TaxID=2716341 RepID=UPI00146D36DB|nr:hypothetical protein [Micromonospora sp. HNM0581]NLU79483.1 hypothetical protein [Micromonospora sp. HNM0581]
MSGDPVSGSSNPRRLFLLARVPSPWRHTASRAVVTGLTATVVKAPMTTDHVTIS